MRLDWMGLHNPCVMFGAKNKYDYSKFPLKIIPSTWDNLSFLKA